MSETGFVTPAENRPGSDTRRRIAGNGLSLDLQGRGMMWPLRELQWDHATPGGLVWVAPPCYERELRLASAGRER